MSHLRQQNALPSWIERSTLTGELTAAGAAQHVKTDHGVTIHHQGQEEGMQSPKKGAAAPDDDVDEYYATLAAAQANNPVASTSYTSVSMRKEDEVQSTHGSPVSSGKLVDSGYEEFGDEIDGGKNGFYSYSPTPASPSKIFDSSAHSRSHSGMDSLRPPSAASMTNSLGKRSREASEESVEDDNEIGKKSRTGEITSFANATNTIADDKTINAQNEKKEGQAKNEEDGAEEEEIEDPILTVAGKEMRFSAITEEMTSDMTAEEYTLWWETLSTME